MADKSANKPKKGAHLIKKQAPKPEKPAQAVRTEAKQPKKKRRVPIGVKIAVGVVIAAAAGAFGYVYCYPNVFPGVTVGPITVGGMNRDDAANTIEDQSTPLYEGKNVTVTIYDSNYDIPVDKVLKSVDGIQSAENAYEIGRTGNPLERVHDIIGAMRGHREAQIAATVDEESLRGTLNEIADTALTEPVNPTWELKDSNLIVHSGKPGVKFDTDAVEQALTDQIRLMDFEPYEVSTDVTAAPAIDVDKIAADIIGDPVNATVSKKDGKTIIAGKAGVSFDTDKAREIIGDGSQETYTIPVTITQPSITAETLKAKLFHDTLARTATNLDEGNAPRTNNIRLAAKAINGTILNPGDEFSYNGTVGERTAARGYQEAHAYSGGKIIDEFGGGVCQPSSTLYMAVLRADLKVIERHNHSFTVSYTPLGEDATVDYGNLDFRFVNNTAYPVKILAEQTDGQMIMTIVGTKTSDKTVTTRTEVLETDKPETVTKTDSSMEAGDSRVETSGITGYSTKTYKQITENGKTTEVLANSSTYSKRDEVVYVGE